MIRQSSQEAAARASSTISRATIKKISDGHKLRELDLEALKDERLPGVEHFETYGLSAVPVSSSDAGSAEAIVAYIGGSRSHPVVIATGDRRSRPKGRPEGDVTLYHYNGSEVHLANDGINVNSAGNPINVTVGGVTFKISADGVDIQGGTITHNGKNIGSDHVHTGIQPGPANTGPPA
ncbi:hypothetical protein LMIY3S_03702 [Labrys miyagiensis]